MDSKKVSIIGLVIIGILFAVGQVGGLFRDDRDVPEDKPAEQRTASQEQSGWTGRIKSGLSGLGLIDGVDVSRVSMKALADPTSPVPAAVNCSWVESEGRLILKPGAGCILQAEIKGIKNDDKQSVELNVTAGCDQERDFARLKRITSTNAVRPHITVPAIGSGTQGGSTTDESSDTWPGLIITYKPKGGVVMEEPWECGDEPEPVTLIILPKGGTLTLKCSKCSGSKKLQVQFGD